jgi:CrcB protein
MNGTLAGALVVAAGGAVGSVLRALLTWSVAARTDGATMPATLAANVLGSFVLGVVVQLGGTTGAPSPAWRLFLTTGVCGGFTTFSTFSFEAVSAFEDGRAGIAIGYALLSLVAGALAMWGGLALGRALAR